MPRIGRGGKMVEEASPMHIKVEISCPHCEQEQVVHVRAKQGFAQVGPHPVVCLKCQHEFEAPVLDVIVAGPFRAMSVEERTFQVVQTSGNSRNVIGEMTAMQVYAHVRVRLGNDLAAAEAVIAELEESGTAMARFNDSFGVETCIEIRSLEKDSWENTIDGATFVYSTEGVAGSGFIHECERRLGNTTTNTSAQSTKQLTRREIEAVPRFVEFVSSYRARTATIG